MPPGRLRSARIWPCGKIGSTGAGRPFSSPTCRSSIRTIALIDRPESGRYLLPDLLADIASGHNVVATVYLEWLSMYRADGPADMRPVGEIEFANGVAAMSASGGYGKPRVCAGIVGHADLALGARVAPVLEAMIASGGGRFRGIRFIASSDPDQAQ